MELEPFALCCQFGVCSGGENWLFIDAMWEVESSQRLQALDEVRGQSSTQLLSVVQMLVRGLATARQRGPVFLVYRRRRLVTDLAAGRLGRSWFGGLRGSGQGSVWEGLRVGRAAWRILT